MKNDADPLVNLSDEMMKLCIAARAISNAAQVSQLNPRKLCKLIFLAASISRTLAGLVSFRKESWALLPEDCLSFCR